jgi:two-component system chemotaxis response regulator CheB
MVVDDSTVIRRLVTLCLENDPCLEVVGTAQNGKEALDRLVKLAPDVVTLDIEMPEMDGLGALPHIRRLAPEIRVVMLSTLTERGASATLEALSLGADDYVTKQSAGTSVEDSTARLRAELVPKIKQFFTFSGRAQEFCAARPPAVASLPTPAAFSQPPNLKPVLRRPDRAPEIVVIGISTGGPTALSAILPEVPKDFALPILIVQHMPALFTKLLCERLQERSQIPVREAAHGELVKAGAILIAPGDYHMRVERGADQMPRICLDQGEPENSCRPAVDVLFESVAKTYGSAAVAAVLTGMGHDGLRGAKLLKQAGAAIYAQDEESSAVWGMPRAIAEANLADAVLPLDALMPQILRHFQPSSGRPKRSLQETR